MSWNVSLTLACICLCNLNNEHLQIQFFIAVLPDCTGTMKESNTGRQIAYKDDE